MLSNTIKTRNYLARWEAAGAGHPFPGVYLAGPAPFWIQHFWQNLPNESWRVSQEPLVGQCFPNSGFLISKGCSCFEVVVLRGFLNPTLGPVSPALTMILQSHPILNPLPPPQGGFLWMSAEPRRTDPAHIIHLPIELGRESRRPGHFWWVISDEWCWTVECN